MTHPIIFSTATSVPQTPHPMIHSNCHAIAIAPSDLHGRRRRLPLPSSLTMRLQGPQSQRLSISTNKPRIVPARDRLVDFGKYRGKMLGTLPSAYLRWISNNLRAGDTEEWSKLADEVLEDPVYRDRIEWEFAEGLLTGNSVSSTRTAGAVSELLEISERFGWDNQDKLGWSKVNFELLGTSKGGRIPRKVRATDKPEIDRRSGTAAGLDPNLVEEDEKRRRERRERLRLKRSGVSPRTKLATPAAEHTRAVKNAGSSPRDSASWGRRVGDHDEELSSSSSSDLGSQSTAQGVTFPGRQGLLKKAVDLKHRRRRSM